MGTFDTFKTIPVGAVLTLPEEERLPALQKINPVPQSVKALASAERTGAYIRGLARTYNLSLEQSWSIALTLLHLFTGELRREEFANALSHNVGMDPDSAAKLAKDIDHELLNSINLDLNRYLGSKQQGNITPPLATPSVTPPKQTFAPTPPRNVLNLKNPTPPSRQLPPPKPPVFPTRAQ